MRGPQMAESTNTQSQSEITVIEGHRVACDGGGVLGHPRVYLELGGNNFVICGYCDKRFVKKGSSEDPNN